MILLACELHPDGDTADTSPSGESGDSFEADTADSGEPEWFATGRIDVEHATTAWRGDYTGRWIAGIDFEATGAEQILVTGASGAWVLPGDGPSEATPSADAWALASGVPGYRAAAGDIDGDGVHDLVVSNIASTDPINAGEVYVLPNPGRGETGVSSATTVLLGPHSGAYAGSSLAVAEVTGDTLADVLVGANGDDRWGTSAGAVYVLEGRSSGPHDPDAYITLWGVLEEAAGSALATSDLDGDGASDVVVGAATGTWGGGGAVYLVSGPLVADVALADAEVLRPTDDPVNRDGAGWALAVGDHDADGYPDLLAGSPYWHEIGADYELYKGRAQLYGGPVGGGATPIAEMEGHYYAQLAGDSVGLGDLDADGRDDAAVGGSAGQANEHAAGGVWVQRGPLSGVLSTADAEMWVYDSGSDREVGKAIALLDLDGDGRDTLVVGSPGLDAGVVYVLPVLFP